MWMIALMSRRQRPLRWSRPVGSPAVSASERVDNRRWRVFFAGHLATIASQQVIANPALLTRGSIAQKRPGPPSPGV